MKFAPGKILFGASVIAIASSAFIAPAFAQDEAGIEASEIVVTARRKDERLQDVPLTVNAASAEDLNKLNIRKFDEITAVMPGLNMAADAKGYAPTATVRGVNYDTNASGLNGTIEFYLNDAPVSAGALFQTMYDMGQVELLRGPQGTLRGRATPSGSMTVTTHRVNMSELGGYVSGTATDIGGINANGALNIPLIPDVLAIRVSALVDENEANRVHSVNNGTSPYSRTSSERVSVRFEPTSNLKFDLMYQRMIQNSRTFDQVMSNGLITASTPGYFGTTTPIAANDRLSVEDNPRALRQEYHILNWQGEWAFGGQKLNYVGSFWRQKVNVADTLTADPGDFFGPTTATSNFATIAANPGIYGAQLAQIAGGCLVGAITCVNPNNSFYHTDSQARNYSHEIRLSSEEPLFGKLDYIVGAFSSQLTPPTVVQTPSYMMTGPNEGFAMYTNVRRTGQTKEKSLFGNLTYHLGEATEISGGARYIYYESYGHLNVVNQMDVDTENKHWNAVIYSASIKHRISDDLMVYASTGSSWRPGLSVVGDFNPPALMTANEIRFTQLDPEKSKSYEIGFKSSFLNKRIKLNVTAYHQDFTNYPFRVGGLGVKYAALSSSGYGVKQFNFVGAVPVKVDGVEAEGSFQVSRDWSIGGNVSYSKSKIKNGNVPCDNYPAALDPSNPTAAEILAAGGPAACLVSASAGVAPKFAATVQSEYSHAISDNVTGYIRGMAQIYGSVAHDAANTTVAYPSYALLNLYAGIRDPKGAWELSLYGKNITKTKRVLSNTPIRAAVNGASLNTAYNSINYTAPREFGVNLRYAFGSR